MAVRRKRLIITEKQQLAMWGGLHVPWELRLAVLRRDRFMCRYCGDTKKGLTMDHVTPVSKGGNTTYDNLVTACKKCNRGKGADLWTPQQLEYRRLHLDLIEKGFQ